MQIKYIVTHGGQFHGDEVLAIALINIAVGIFPIERRNPTDEEIKDPLICVLDAGRIYDPQMGNFDHHHDASLESTNVLVLNELIKDLEIRELLYKNLFKGVSDHDRGISMNPQGFNSIIANFNSLVGGFEKAIQIATEILYAYIASAKEAISTRRIYYELEKIGQVRLNPTTHPLIGWKELAKSEGTLAMITPNREAGKWSLTSVDTEIFKIPVNKRQDYLHPTKFFAVYLTLEELLAHVREIQELC